MSGVAVADLGIPEGVREVVGRRLGRLSEAANTVLRSAAVLGVEFDLDVLRVDAGGDGRSGPGGAPGRHRGGGGRPPGG